MPSKAGAPNNSLADAAERDLAREPDGDEPWYQAAFGEHYLDVYAHRDAAAAATEVDFILKVLALRPGARVLDLACGAGRHLEALADAGCKAIGLDLSAALLRQARGRGLTVVRADMRTIPLADESQDAVVNLFTSFGYFADDAENARVLDEIARVLRPGGVFLIDHINATRIESRLVPETRRDTGEHVIIERRRLDHRRRRVEKSVEVSRAKDTPAETLRYEERVRYYTSDEFAELLRAVGLEPQQWFGSLQGDAFGPNADRMVALARRNTR